MKNLFNMIIKIAPRQNAVENGAIELKKIDRLGLFRIFEITFHISFDNFILCLFKIM